MAGGALEAWYMADEVKDQTAENRREPNVPASPQVLLDLGVLNWKVPPDGYKYPQKAVPWQPDGIQDPALKKIRDMRGYGYADIITCSEACLPNYHDKLKDFFKEHIHSDEEVRYIVGGSGYFDVRDHADKWIRIKLDAGDIIVLPEGIYHRFSMDASNYTHAMRLFKGVPVWTPINRPADEHESRLTYIKSFMQHDEESQLRKAITATMRSFFNFGWCLGSSGAMSARIGDGPRAPMLVTPSGVQKELLGASDLFVVGADGVQLKVPSNRKVSKVTDSVDVIQAIYEHRPEMRAVCHIHSIPAILAMSQEPSDTLRVRDIEMIKGLGVCHSQVLHIPIIDNKPKETDLTPDVRKALQRLPKAPAVLVRDHGVYVWGETAEKAKLATECMAFVLDVVRQQRCDDPARKRMRCVASGSRVVLLDIEGTTTPITFVKDKLFPYAASAVGPWVKTAGAEDLAKVATAFAEQCKQDGTTFTGNDQIPTLAKEWIAKDRKVPALKELQGSLWRAGYESGDLVSEMYEDTPTAMEQWVHEGRRVAVFSSGSREAQQLIFQYSNKGDLTSNISAYFDPASAQAPKQQVSAYVQIALSLGIRPSEGHFCTDILGEAQAARAAGWKATLLLRPGNAPLPADHGFPTASSLLDIEP